MNNIESYVVVHYPNGEMEQLSIRLKDYDEAIKFLKNSRDGKPNERFEIIAILKV